MQRVYLLTTGVQLPCFILDSTLRNSVPHVGHSHGSILLRSQMMTPIEMRLDEINAIERTQPVEISSVENFIHTFPAWSGVRYPD